jgi:hypothetical protein
MASSTAITRAFASFARMFKSIPDKEFEDRLSDVLDQWTEPDSEHRNPTRGAIVTGPAERANGSGAVKMIGDYSNPAPQFGLAGEYVEFSRMLDDWGKSFTSHLNSQITPIISRHEKAIGSLVGLFDAISKEVPSETTYVGTARLKLAKAKTALRKADLADEDEDGDSKLTEARRHLAAAKRLLARAVDDEEPPVDESECEKAMADLRALTKALEKAPSGTDTGDGTDDEEAADRDRPGATEISKESRKSVPLKDVEEALKGLKALPQTVQGLMDVIAGQSRYPGGPPEMMKAVQKVDLAARIEDAINEGRLSEVGATRALTLLNHLAIAKAGRVDMAYVQHEIDESPEEVRTMFQTN